MSIVNITDRERELENALAEEQRLNGMGAEREYVLQGQVNQLIQALAQTTEMLKLITKERDRLKAQLGDLPKEILTSEMLIEAALSASAAGLLSGTTNWAKHVQQNLLVKQPTTPAVGNTTCNPHPDAPHGFDRNASLAEGRYVCECEGWMPPTVSKDN